MSTGGSNLGRLWQYARTNHGGRVKIATTYSILNRIFDLAPPVLIGAAVDVVTTREESLIARMGVPDTSMQLYLLAAVTVLIWVAESVFEYLLKINWRNLAQNLQHDLRNDAYGHVQGLEMRYFEDRSTGGLMSILNDDVNQLERFLDVGANQLLQMLTSVVVIGLLFFYLDASVALYAFLPVPLVIWGSFAFQKRIAPRYADVRERVGILNSQLSNNLSGIATIKSFTAEAHEAERIRQSSAEYQESNRRAISLSSAFSPLIRMIIVLGFTATLLIGGHNALEGTLAVGAFSTMVFMTQRLLWPLTSLGEMFDLYQRAMASTHRILNVLDAPQKIVSGSQSLPTSDSATTQDATANSASQNALAVRFDNVEFGYHTESATANVQARPHKVLHGLSLDMPAGKTTAIVGATGAGKSTIVKLLLRYYDVNSGSVSVEGIDVRELNLDSLRSSIGLVSQDVYLFHGTVRENVAYGRRDADFASVQEAARLAEALDFIEALPQGWDTIVGERGQKLSGGQRQRISIARAILKDPPILVLDEATSSVDNETEAAIQRSLERVAVGRTTIVIAHRLSTVRNADRIYTLERGQVSETGQHQELIENGGLYASLWKVQTGSALAL